MTQKDEKLLAEFEMRMRQLMYFCDTLKEENTSLKQELSLKNAAVESLKIDVEQLNTRYDNLKLAKALLDTDKSEVHDARKKISKLVRDVDKCIALLKS